LDVEKGAVLGEDRMRKSSMTNAVLKMLQNHAGGSWSIGTRFPIGKDPIIRSWTSQDVENYRNKWYHPKQMVLYVVGDIDLKVDKINAQLGRITSNTRT
jgi:zinc protease